MPYKKKTVLKFEKSLFTKKEVAKIPKERFDFPKAWKLGSTKKEHTLTFEPNLVQKHYALKKKLLAEKLKKKLMQKKLEKKLKKAKY